MPVTFLDEEQPKKNKVTFIDKPMFSNMEEANKAQAIAREEQKRAEFNATPQAVINRGLEFASKASENSILGGIPDIISRTVTGKGYVPKEADTRVSDVAGAVIGPGGAGLAISKRVIPRLISSKNVTNLLDKTKTGIKQLALAGGIGGFLTAPQDGTDIKQRLGQSAVGAVTGATIPAASKAINRIPVVKDFVAGRLVNNLIKPTDRQFMYGKNPGLAMAKEGISGKNLDDISVKVKAVLNNRTNELNNIVKNSNQTISMDSIISPIDDAIAKVSKQGPAAEAVIKRLRDARLAITNVYNEAGIVGPRNLSNMSPVDAVELKRLVGDLTKWTGNYGDDTVINKALKGTYSLARRKIETAVPATRKVNSRIASLIDADKAISRSINREMSKDIIPRGDVIIGGIGGTLGGIASGGNLPAAINTAIASAGINRVIKSPKFVTGVASWLAKAPAKQKQEFLTKYPEIINAINSLGVSGTSSVLRRE